uniref:Uncharacterized protein n=1 Tax=Siphoviridae sp. ctss15 TaxID=2825699 RepID=A0A8S5TRC5_9CAUD|nr:MAG TPA: hypothetical protein [Siphoviridae sp. ctss15]
MRAVAALSLSASCRTRRREKSMADTLFFGGIAAAVIALNGCDFTTGLAVIGACAVCKVLYELLPYIDRGRRR